MRPAPAGVGRVTYPAPSHCQRLHRWAAEQLAGTPPNTKLIYRNQVK